MSWIVSGAQKVNFNPSYMTTALWLDAADTETITTVSGGVSQWNDKSGNSINATQATSGSRPTISTNTLNSRQTLDFQTSKFVSHSGVALRSLAIVARVESYSNLDSLVGEPVNGYGLRLDNITSYRIGNNDDFPNPTGRVVRVNGYPTNIGTLTSWHIVTVTIPIAPRFSFNRVGKYFDGYGMFLARPWNGEIAEVIYSTSTLEIDKLNTLEGYLAHKWGLTTNLPSDHPWKFNPPPP